MTSRSEYWQHAQECARRKAASERCSMAQPLVLAHVRKLERFKRALVEGVVYPVMGH
jgi:hypothetical protein